MIALLQRVTTAQVHVAGHCIAAIQRGLLVFIAVQPQDDETGGERLLERVLNYRVFPDASGRMNLNVRQIAGGVLLVPQFTLAADTTSGNRPSFTTAASPAHAELSFTHVCDHARNCHHPVACGRFGADMQISLINDGPVTFWLTT